MTAIRLPCQLIGGRSPSLWCLDSNGVGTTADAPLAMGDGRDLVLDVTSFPAIHYGQTVAAVAVELRLHGTKKQ